MNCCTAWPAPFGSRKPASYPSKAGANGRCAAKLRGPLFVWDQQILGPASGNAGRLGFLLDSLRPEDQAGVW
jgi:hypothetical protein